MLPASYQLPAAIVLLLGGVVSCFFGYRLFRIVLALFGFIIGALAASSIMAASNSTAMLIAAGVGGLIGAGILFAAYFIGVTLVGAGLGALVANLAFSASGHPPHFLVVVLCSIVGAAAHSTDAIANHATPTMKTLRRPSRSPSEPPTRIRAASVSV